MGQRDRRGHQTSRHSVLVQVSSCRLWTCLDDDLQDARCHEPHLQGRDAPRQGQQESCAECRDTGQDQLQTHCYYARSNVRILKSLANLLHFTLVLTCAATALRSSEILALRWADILWNEEKIRVSKRWSDGREGPTKTDASDGYVPLHPLLARHLQDWRERTPYASATDFVFPSFRRGGRVPLSASIFVADHLRPAAIAAGVSIQPSQRFGLHNLRHSLSTFLVNTAKVQAKTVQGILRHSRIQTTLDLYTQGDSDETRAAQGEFLKALGMPSGAVQ